MSCFSHKSVRENSTVLTYCVWAQSETNLTAHNVVDANSGSKGGSIEGSGVTVHEMYRMGGCLFDLMADPFLWLVLPQLRK